MARGEHRPGQTARSRGEVQPVRAGQADEHDITPLGADSLGKGRDEVIP